MLLWPRDKLVFFAAPASLEGELRNAELEAFDLLETFWFPKGFLAVYLRGRLGLTPGIWGVGRRWEAMYSPWTAPHHMSPICYSFLPGALLHASIIHSSRVPH